MTPIIYIIIASHQPAKQASNQPSKQPAKQASLPASKQASQPTSKPANKQYNGRRLICYRSYHGYRKANL